MGEIKQDARDLRDTGKEKLRDVDGHDLKDDLGNAGDRIRTGIDNAGDKLREGVDDVRDTARHGERNERVVQDPR